MTSSVPRASTLVQTPRTLAFQLGITNCGDGVRQIGLKEDGAGVGFLQAEASSGRKKLLGGVSANPMLVLEIVQLPSKKMGCALKSNMFIKSAKLEKLTLGC